MPVMQGGGGSVNTKHGKESYFLNRYSTCVQVGSGRRLPYPKIYILLLTVTDTFITPYGKDNQAKKCLGGVR